MDRVKKAEQLFLEGYNCAQAVAGAFCDEMDLPQDVVMKMSGPFGGGMGRMREVCGACSGMFMVAGTLFGYDTPETGEKKAEMYAEIRELADAFRSQNGSIICREILGPNVQVGGLPEQRTDEYYKDRPCLWCVHSAAMILEQYIERKRTEC